MDRFSKHLFRISFLLFLSCQNADAGETNETRYQYGDFSFKMKGNSYPFISSSLEASLIFIPTKISLDAGFGLLISTNDKKLYEMSTWNIGLKFFVRPLEVKFCRFVEIKFGSTNYKYDVAGYDTAIPAIPVRATLTHTVSTGEGMIGYGIRYQFTKKLYCQGVAGISYGSFKDIDPTFDETTIKNKSKAVMQLYGYLGIGVRL